MEKEKLDKLTDALKSAGFEVTSLHEEIIEDSMEEGKFALDGVNIVLFVKELKTKTGTIELSIVPVSA